MPGSYNRAKFLDRKLEDRSFLLIDFPKGKSSIPISVKLPFFENITVTESKKANLAIHQPIGRSSPLFSYIGGKPKQIKLQFNLTLPLLVEQAINFSRFIQFAASQNKEDQRRSFFRIAPKVGQIAGNSDVLIQEYLQSLRDQHGNQYVQSFLGDNGQLTGEEIKQFLADHNQNESLLNSAFLNGFLGVIDKIEDGLGTIGGWVDSFLPFSTPQNREINVQGRNEIISVLLWWIQVIRSTVLNNAVEPVNGPPVVRLNHGILYRDVPCVCADYTMTVDGDSGMDLKTLLPRVISVSMNLYELRAGDFGRFKPGELVKRDNLTGYESLFEEGYTMDPQPILNALETEEDAINEDHSLEA